jgi:hypothetical protein
VSWKPLHITQRLAEISEVFDNFENTLVGLVLATIPWLAPVPSAILIARASITHLNWSSFTGMITAIIIEGMGITSIKLALVLRRYNLARRKNDEAAPFLLAASLVGIYFLTAVSLTILLDIYPKIARFAPGVFPIFTLIGGVNIALWTEHKDRLNGIQKYKLERKARRSTLANHRVQVNGNNGSESLKMNTHLDRMNVSRKAKLDVRLDALVNAYHDNPGLTPTEAASLLGVSRTTIYSYREKLAKQGKLNHKPEPLPE